MNSPVLIATAVYSFVGLCINSTILFLLAARGRRPYQLMFAILPAICAIWDLGILIEMIRNTHLDELALYGTLITPPAILMGGAMFHFTHLYTGRGSKWLVALFWAITLFVLVRILTGIAPMVEGTLSFSWGNLHKAATSSLFDIGMLAFWYAAILFSIWLLYRFRQETADSLRRRHAGYILVGFATITVATVKIAVTYGLDVPFLLPLCMALTDVFGAIIGLAILKDRLLDITVIVKKTAIYSALAAAAMVVFGLCEHFLASAVAEFFGEESEFLHLISIAVVIALALPLKQQVERFVEGRFAQRTVQV